MIKRSMVGRGSVAAPRPPSRGDVAAGTMRAAVHTRYGAPDVMRISEVPVPVPADDELLVAVRATTVNRTDCGFRRPDPVFVRLFSGLRRPKQPILGTEFAGEVVAVGASVNGFDVGDRVFGVNADRFGAHAEYVCVAGNAPVATMPAGMGFEEAAAVCDGAILALANLRRAHIEERPRILIYGASGSIGTAAVQLAVHFGARVTAVCDPRGVETVRSLGAHDVIDRSRRDFAADGQTYDVIFDAVGKSSFWHCRRALAPDGLYLVTDLGRLWQNPALASLTRFSARKVALPIPHYTQDDVLLVKALVESGRYRAVVDRRYALEDIVDAMRYVETEQKIGNVVLTVGSGEALRDGAIPWRGETR